MKDKFNIVTDIKKTTLYLDKIVVNFPRSEKVLKDKIMDSIYTVLELVYLANESTGDRRCVYQKKIVTKFKMIDFYLKVAVDKKYIPYKKYQKVNMHLLNNLKQIYGWIKSEKNLQPI